MLGGYRQLNKCYELVIPSYMNDCDQVFIRDGCTKDYSKSQYRGELCRENRLKCRFARLHHSICAIDSKAFMVTGSLEESGCDKCELYDIEKDKWTIMPSMNKGK